MYLNNLFQDCIHPCHVYVKIDEKWKGIDLTINKKMLQLQSCGSLPKIR